jgi:hypothetical protein
MIYKRNTLRNIKKAFKTASIPADIYQTRINEFNEEDGEELLITIDGIFYEETSKMNLNISTNGKTTTKTYQSLMVLKDDESDLIKEHMICSIKGKRYEIIDVKNDAKLDIYYILRLSEV